MARARTQRAVESIVEVHERACGAIRQLAVDPEPIDAVPHAFTQDVERHARIVGELLIDQVVAARAHRTVCDRERCPGSACPIWMRSSHYFRSRDCRNPVIARRRARALGFIVRFG
jgi:hypothetical protein